MDPRELIPLFRAGKSAYDLYKSFDRMHKDSPNLGGMLTIGLQLPKGEKLTWKSNAKGLLATAWMEKGTFSVYDGRTFVVTDTGLDLLSSAGVPILGEMFGVGRWKSRESETFYSSLGSFPRLAFGAPQNSWLEFVAIDWDRTAHEQNLLRDTIGYSHLIGRGIYSACNFSGFRGRVYAEWSSLRVSDDELRKVALDFVRRA